MFRKYKLDDLVESGNPMEYLSLNIDLFRLFGFWPKKSQKSRRSRFFLLLGWPIIIVILYITFLATEIIDVYLIWGDVQHVTENLCVTFTMVNMTFKMAHFICRNEKIQKLVQDLHVQTKGWDDEDKKNHKRVLRDCVKRARSLTLAANSLVFITALIWGSMSYCFGPAKTLPMRAWYPFDTTVSPYYEIASLFQIITLCFMPYTYISFTIFYVVLIIHACGNFAMLRDMLINTRERAERRVRKPLLKKPRHVEVGDFNTDMLSRENTMNPSDPTVLATEEAKPKGVSFIDVEPHPSFTGGNQDLTLQVADTDSGSWMVEPSEPVSHQPLRVDDLKENKEVEINIAAHQCLAEVVMLHQAILGFIKDLDAVFRPILTIQLLFSLLIIGQIGFQAAALSHQTEGLLKFMSYFSCAVTELLLYCWYSEELNHQAQLVADSAYSCDWFTSTSGFKKSLQIVMIRSQRPEIRPGRATMTMSCHTCTLILKNSYSLFALLKQLGET